MAESAGLGGFSRGLTSGIGTMNNIQQLRQQKEAQQQEAELRRQTIEITRQQMGQQRLEAESRKYESGLKTLVDAVNGTQSSDQAAKLVQSLANNGVLKGLNDQAEVVGASANAEQLLMSLINTKRSEEEQIALKGQEATVTAEAQARATAKFRAPAAPNNKNYITPTGQRGIVNADDPAAIARLPAGSQLFSTVSQPTNAPGFDQPGIKEGQDARNIISESTGNVAQGTEVLSKVSETPFGTGFRGTLAEAGSGILQQIPGLGGAAEQFSEAVAGGSIADVTKLRTDLRMRVSGMLRAISGDQTDRYTNQDRERAEAALRAMSPDAGPDQIVAATKAAMEMDIISRERAKAKLGVSPYTDVNRLEAEAQKLVGAGFSEDEAADIAVRIHKEMLDLQEQLKAPSNAPK